MADNGKNGKYENTKIWISGERKELFRWNKHFSYLRRAIIWWKIKIWWKITGTSSNKYWKACINMGSLIFWNGTLFDLYSGYQCYGLCTEPIFDLKVPYSGVFGCFLEVWYN